MNMALKSVIYLLLVQCTGLICADPSDGLLRRFILDGGVDGSWGGWSHWSSCSVTCGDGARIRNRTCVYPSHVPQGRFCSGSATEQGSCHSIQLCPDVDTVDGTWGTWKNWGSCTVTCGDGTRTRQRTCTYPPRVPQGDYCAGIRTEKGSCNTISCPVDGMWGSWKSWSSCTVSCGDGTRTRIRTCMFPPRVPQGDYCAGSVRERGSCNTISCPAVLVVDGTWGSWSNWSSCTVTCGGGTRTRRRHCTFPPRVPQGDYCAGSGRDTGGSCNTISCPV